MGVGRIFFLNLALLGGLGWSRSEDDDRRPSERGLEVWREVGRRTEGRGGALRILVNEALAQR